MCVITGRAGPGGGGWPSWSRWNQGDGFTHIIFDVVSLLLYGGNNSTEMFLYTQGEKGDMGQEGDNGEKGEIGLKGKEGPPGSPGLMGFRVSVCPSAQIHTHIFYNLTFLILI